MRHAILALIPILLLSILSIQTSALTIDVSGGCVDKEITVTADRESTVVFRMNFGTPIFAQASPDSPARFIPRVVGKLSITVIAGSESESRIVDVKACPSEVAEGRALPNTLPSGSFDVLGQEAEWRTAYGALKKASELEGFTITPKLTEWGVFVDCIKDLCTGDLGETSGWMYWVNYPEKPMPGVAATEYRIYPEDKILWYFSRSMSETPDTSPYKIIITIGEDYKIYVSMIWPKKIPPYPSFTFTPPNPVAGQEVKFDASKSVDDGEIVSYLWDFGDGNAGEGVVVSHAYSKPGNYTVRLTVIDNDGLSSTVGKEITVGQNVSLRINHSITIPRGNVNISIPEDVARNLSVYMIWISEHDTPLKISLSEAQTTLILYRNVYSCFNLEINSSVSGRIYFRIPKDLVGDREVVLMKFENYWVDLPTEKAGEDEKYAYFSSSVENFGTFAVTIKWKNFPLKPEDNRIAKALEWLRSIQNEDGGFANPGESSSVSKTSWAVMAIAAAGENPENWKKNGKSPVDYMRDKLPEEIDKMGIADFARTILALVYAGENPRNFAGIDLVEKLKSKVKQSGQIGDFTYTTIWGIIALKAAGENVSKSVEWLKSQQNEDGGFAWNPGEKSDFDDTAAAIQALIAGGLSRDSEIIKRALDYLKTGQNDDGGMRYFGSSASNAASDSWTIQALVAAGINPDDFKRNNRSVVGHLLSLQTAEGYFKYTEYQTSNPGYMTVSAVMALLGKPHPMNMYTASASASMVTTTTATTTTATPTAAQTTATTIATTTIATATTAITATATMHITPAEKPGIPGFSVLLSLLALIVALRLKLRGRE